MHEKSGSERLEIQGEWHRAMFSEKAMEQMLTTRTGTSLSTPRRAALFTATRSKLFLLLREGWKCREREMRFCKYPTTMYQSRRHYHGHMAGTLLVCLFI